MPVFSGKQTILLNSNIVYVCKKAAKRRYSKRIMTTLAALPDLLQLPELLASHDA
jgi:hypothetical protein